MLHDYILTKGGRASVTAIYTIPSIRTSEGYIRDHRTRMTPRGGTQRTTPGHACCINNLGPTQSPIQPYRHADKLQQISPTTASMMQQGMGNGDGGIRDTSTYSTSRYGSWRAPANPRKPSTRRLPHASTATCRRHVSCAGKQTAPINLSLVSCILYIHRLHSILLGVGRRVSGSDPSPLQSCACLMNIWLLSSNCLLACCGTFDACASYNTLRLMYKKKTGSKHACGVKGG